jgi:vacuolar-type H+-ATPase subunit I/STV1
MPLGDRENLLRRIRQIRRTNAPPNDPPPVDERDPLDALEVRVAHLEQLLEGLQDSVHRESERHAELIAALQAQVEPGTMSAALAEEARSRGL